MNGAGLFPTGRSICFRPDSPVRLADGAGAICLRATQGGVISVSASAPGLSGATLELHCCDTSSAPTPPAADELAPSVSDVQATAAAPLLTAELAQNRPCRASSNDEQAALATDGDPTSAWQPAEKDSEPTLTLDLEFCVSLGHVQVAGTQALRILCTADGQQWAPFRPGIRARYLRLGFPRAARVFHVSVQPQH